MPAEGVVMVVHGLLAKAAGAVFTGLVGVTAYETVRTAVAKAPVRAAAVATTAWGIRGARKAEEGAESLRLRAGDVMTEARARVGEEVPPPAVADAPHGHDH
jgi:microcystin degradation protein MlrC